MPSLKQILLSYPLLIPAILVLLPFLSVVFVYRCLTSGFRRSNCPGCPYKKRLCLVACDEVSRELDEMEKDQGRTDV
jgi:hypothetical protein